MKILIETDTEKIEEELTADARGRVTLGKEYANQTVSVAVIPENDEEILNLRDSEAMTVQQAMEQIFTRTGDEQIRSDARNILSKLSGRNSFSMDTEKEADR